MPNANGPIWKAFTGRRLSLIAGPCVIESEQLCLKVAAALKKTCDRLGLFYVFKASFDKANRTSEKSFRGPGLDAGLKTLAKVREEVGVPVLTDVHSETQASVAADVVDILQIPAFLCRQTDLIEAVAATGNILNLKKGQFLSPVEMGQVVTKAVEAGAKRILVTERGTTFGYNNLVADMRSIPILKTFGFPVIFDATHSVQLPGGGGDRIERPTGVRALAGPLCGDRWRQWRLYRNASSASARPERRSEHDPAGGDAASARGFAESFRRSSAMNLEPPTSDAEHRTDGSSFISSAFRVRRSMFGVLLRFP